MRKTTKEYNDSYYERHREEILARVKAYQAAHREEVLARLRKRRMDDPEKTREDARKYRAEHREHINALSKERRDKNPEKTRTERLRVSARWKARKVERAARPRPDKCEVCGRPPDGKSITGKVLHWDHDHKSGEFRGWICRFCNSALGYTEDNPAILRALADYLDRFSANRPLHLLGEEAV